MEEIVGAKILRQESVSDVSGSAGGQGGWSRVRKWRVTEDKIRQKRRGGLYRQHWAKAAGNPAFPEMGNPRVF